MYGMTNYLNFARRSGRRTGHENNRKEIVLRRCPIYSEYALSIDENECK